MLNYAYIDSVSFVAFSYEFVSYSGLTYAKHVLHCALVRHGVHVIIIRLVSFASSIQRRLRICLLLCYQHVCLQFRSFILGLPS
jgi:hypothetical protein